MNLKLKFKECNNFLKLRIRGKHKIVKSNWLTRFIDENLKKTRPKAMTKKQSIF